MTVSRKLTIDDSYIFVLLFLQMEVNLVDSHKKDGVEECNQIPTDNENSQSDHSLEKDGDKRPAKRKRKLTSVVWRYHLCLLKLLLFSYLGLVF